MSKELKVNNLILKLKKAKKDKKGFLLERILKEIKALVPEIEPFFEIFRITADVNQPLGEEQLEAVQTRILASLKMGKTKKRVAIIGYDLLARLFARAIVSDQTKDLELVMFVGQPAETIAEWIAHDSLYGSFEDRFEWDQNFFFLGRQKSAIRVYPHHLIDSDAVAETIPWKSLGVDILFLDENATGQINSETLKNLESQGIKVILEKNLNTFNSEKIYIPCISSKEKVKEAYAISLGTPEEIAYSLIIEGLKEISPLKTPPHVLIIEKPEYPATAQPTYRLPGVMQISHKFDTERLTQVAKMFGFKEEEIPETSIFAVPVSQGKVMAISANLSGHISKERLLEYFKKKAKSSTFLSVPEEWQGITTNLVRKKSEIVLDPNLIFTSGFDGGTRVLINLFIDETTVLLSSLLYLLGEEAKTGLEPTRREEHYTRSEILAQVEAAERTSLNRKFFSSLLRSNERGLLAEKAKKSLREAFAKPNHKRSQALSKKQVELIEILLGKSSNKGNYELLRDKNKQPVGITTTSKDGLLTSTSLLSPKTLEKTQETLENYYKDLRKKAKMESQRLKRPILVHDIYNHEEKIKVVWEVSAENFNDETEIFDKVTFKSVIQNLDGTDLVLSRPETELQPAKEEDYNLVINAAGGRMGELTLREAIKKENLKVIAVGGPDEKTLVNLLTKWEYTQGAFEGKVKCGDDLIELNNQKVLVFKSRVGNGFSPFRNPANYPWGCFLFAGIPIDLAVECSGVFNYLEGTQRHLTAGAKRVLIPAPGESKEIYWTEATFIRFINDHLYDPKKHYALSTASCTTGALASLNKLIELTKIRKSYKVGSDEFFEKAKEIVLDGLGLTVHALTGEQFGPDTWDPFYVKDPRRGRSALNRISGTSSGAGKTTALVDPAQIKQPVFAVRVPTAIGSVLASDVILKGAYTYNDIKEAAEVLQKETKGKIRFEEGLDRSSTLRLVKENAEALTSIPKDKVQISHFKNDFGESMTLIRIFGWYENERGYIINHVIEFIEKVMVPAEKRIKQPMDELAPRLGRRLYEKKMTVEDLSDEDLDGKRVFVRADVNVATPVHIPGKGIISTIFDDFRIRSLVDDVKYLRERGAITILSSHNARKKQFVRFQKTDGQDISGFSLNPVWDRLTGLLRENNVLSKGEEVRKLDLLDPKIPEYLSAAKQGDIFGLSNLRAFSGEESGDRYFANYLYDLTRPDIYVNTGFGSAHRGLHGSFSPIMKFLKDKPKVMGLLLKRELKFFDEFLENPQGLTLLILGGATKLPEKLPAVENLIREGKVDKLLLTALAFLVGAGKNVGNSLVEKSPAEQEKVIYAAHNVLKLAAVHGVDIVLPVDFAVTSIFPDMDKPKTTYPTELVDSDSIPQDGYALDIGPETVRIFNKEMVGFNTIILNGTAGLHEVEQFRKGTDAVVDLVASSNAKIKLALGSDGVAAVNRRLGVEEKESGIIRSTGGGAALTYISTPRLNSLDPLDDLEGFLMLHKIKRFARKKQIPLV